MFFNSYLGNHNYHTLLDSLLLGEFIELLSSRLTKAEQFTSSLNDMVAFLLKGRHFYFCPVNSLLEQISH